MLFYIDSLSLVMMVLVSYVALCVASFASRYLSGDSQQCFFYAVLAALVCTVFLMVSADHLLLLLATWLGSNILLTRLMLHKREWEAARQSAILAMKNYVGGFIFLAVAFFMLYMITGETSVHRILSKPIPGAWAEFSSMLILLAAMTQSALWPFHGWLTSSLNSPTPVSAMMHAGLVNGGGFILVRFSPLFLSHAWLLNVVFIVGIVTAMIATFWQLMQHDVKRMLACSTMAQMGFMVAQCGLGLFPAAVAHLCWHGLFKAYLFLSSGSAGQEKRLDLSYPPSMQPFLMALILGVLGAFTFALVNGQRMFVTDTRLFLRLIVLITAAQFVLPIVRGNAAAKIFLASLATVFIGCIYGLSVRLVEQMLLPLDVFNPQPFNILHFFACLMLVFAWLFSVFGVLFKPARYPDWRLRLYVWMLNASQPRPKTITAHRNAYQF